MNRRHVRKTEDDKVTITIEYDRKTQRIEIRTDTDIPIVETVGIIELSKEIIFETVWEDEE